MQADMWASFILLVFTLTTTTAKIITQYKLKLVWPGTNTWAIDELFNSSAIHENKVTVQVAATVGCVQDSGARWHYLAGAQKPPRQHHWETVQKYAFTKDGYFVIRNVGSKDNGTQLRFTLHGLVGNLLVRIQMVYVPERPGAEIIHQSPSVITTNEGNTVTLQCRAHGNPPANISWAKVGNQSVLHWGETYTMSKISRDLAGNYTCTASNGFGADATASFKVTVYYPSRIESGPDDQIVLEASNSFIQCIVSGTPEPMVTWTKDGSKVVIGEGEKLILPKVKSEATGMYNCTAWNGVGEPASATATLTVKPASNFPKRSWNLDWRSLLIGGIVIGFTHLIVIIIVIIIIRKRHRLSHQHGRLDEGDASTGTQEFEPEDDTSKDCDDGNYFEIGDGPEGENIGLQCVPENAGIPQDV